MKKNLYLLLILVALVSCATRDDKIFDEKDSTDEVTESFDLKDKGLEQFKAVEIPIKEQPKTAPEKKVKKKVAKKKKTKVVTKKKIVKKEKVVKKVEPVSLYPEDYPELYAKFNEKYASTFESFNPRFFPGEVFTFEVTYLGVTAGYIQMKTLGKFSVAGKEAYRFKAEAKSAKFYEYIYKLNDTLDVIVDSKNFVPLKYTLVQRESGKDVDDLQLFDHDKLKSYFFYKRVKKGKTNKKEKESYTPRYFQGLFSSMYFVRSLDLTPGNSYEFPVVTRGKVWLLNMKVEGQEEVKALGKKQNAVKLRIKSKPVVENKDKERNVDIEFWVSNDERRTFLKFAANIKLGSISGKLLDYKAGKKLD